MEFLISLWLPILLSAVFVFIASSITHMVLPIHKNEYAAIPGEAGVLKAMRDGGMKPGNYFLPYCGSMKEMSSPEMLEKYNAGPVGFLTVLPNGPPAMGKNLVLWFLFSVVMGVFVAYAGMVGLPAGSDYKTVFRLTGTVAVVGYAVSHVPDSIWKGLGWGVAARYLFEGVIYGLLTGGTFGWLWPEA